LVSLAGGRRGHGGGAGDEATGEARVTEGNDGLVAGAEETVGDSDIGVGYAGDAALVLPAGGDDGGERGFLGLAEGLQGECGGGVAGGSVSGCGWGLEFETAEGGDERGACGVELFGGGGDGEEHGGVGACGGAEDAGAEAALKVEEAGDGFAFGSGADFQGRDVLEGGPIAVEGVFDELGAIGTAAKDGGDEDELGVVGGGGGDVAAVEGLDFPIGGDFDGEAGGVAVDSRS
jgi:hypothetical protein